MATIDMDPTEEDQSKKIAFRFCRECSNMLYPQEDKINSTLMFTCRSCTYSEAAHASCIYRNSLKEEVAETPGNMQEVAQDPTVGAAPASSPPDDAATADVDDMYGSAAIMGDDEVEMVMGEETVPDFCTLCGQEITCPICGLPSENGILLETVEPAEPPSAQQEQEQIELEKRERSLSGSGLQTL